MASMSTPASLVTELRAAGCVFAEQEARLLTGAASGDALTELVRRRVAGEPLEYVLGWAALRGLRIRVAPGVFVPRRRTEFLAGEAIARAWPDARVVDLYCGSGAIGAAIRAEVGDVDLTAADVDPVATDCARENLPDAWVCTGAGFTALPTRLRGRVDVLVANVPYVPTAAIAGLPPEAREHEPRQALDGGGDGLRHVRALAHESPAWLAPAGSLLVEVGTDQAAAACAAFTEAGLRVGTAEDEDTVVVLGQRSG